MSNYQVELRERLVYHVHLNRSDTVDNVFGLTIRAQKNLATNLLTVTVSNVDESGLAKRVAFLFSVGTSTVGAYALARRKCSFLAPLGAMFWAVWLYSEAHNIVLGVNKPEHTSCQRIRVYCTRRPVTFYAPSTGKTTTHRKSIDIPFERAFNLELIGIMSSDELLAINGLHVKRLTPLQVEQILQDCSTLCLVVRTKRLSLPVWLEPVAYNEDSFKLPCGAQGHTNYSSFVELSSPTVPAQQQTNVAAEDDDDNWFSDSCRLLQHKVKYRTSGRHPSLATRGRQRYSLPVIPSHGNNNGSSTNSPPFQNKRESFSAHSSPQQINHFDQRYSIDSSSTASTLLKRISNSEPGGIMITAGQMPAGGIQFSGVNGYANNGNINSNVTNGKMPPTERLEKILFELMQTEKAYVQDLEYLIRTFLEPLIKESILPIDDLRRLTVACASITRFQKTFFEEIQEAVNPGCSSNGTSLSYSSPNHLRNALVRLGGVFLSSAVSFKVYSSFCASYLRVQKLLRNEEQNENLQKFLNGCNTKKQHSYTLESYLIKPVQRVLRYPLFLQQMKSLTGGGTPENGQISEALLKMEKVAEYINEMQRIYEEYGLLFDHAQAVGKSLQNKINFDVCELLMFGEVDWLNFNEDNGNRRKSIPLECLCFVFKSAVLITADRQKNTKKTKGNSASEKLTISRIIPVNELEINGSDVGSSDSQFIWILIHMDRLSSNEKVYYFSSRRLEVKQQFLKAIRKAGALLAKSTGSNSTSQVMTSSTRTAQSPLSPVGTVPSRQNVQYFSSSSAISSPDSGLPQQNIAQQTSSSTRRLLNNSSSNGHVTALSANGAKLSVNNNNNNNNKNNDNLAQNGGPSVKRPISHHSNQSDPGYGSNCELQRRL